jgi:phosphoglycolate phosphatase
MPKAVLFDIDGTLVTFTFDVRGTRKALIEELSKEGLDTSGLDLSSPTQAIINAARRQFESGAARGDYLSLRKKLHSILDSFEEVSAAEATVFPGTKETLLRLRSDGIRLAVLTNAGRRAAFLVLRKTDILDLFEFVLTREDVETMKPWPEGLLMAVERFSLQKGDIVYVGDGVFDIMAAKQAGLKVISVTTGIYSRDRLSSEGADSVISSLTEIPGVLGLSSVPS